jgi:hypothetical protein
MKFKLTEQAFDYLNEIERALSLPHACKCSHEELLEIIAKLKNSDPAKTDPTIEVCKVLCILAKYSYLETTGDIATADKFYDLHHNLFNLIRLSGVMKIQNIENNLSETKKEVAHDSDTR